jgi:hypothetical protein
MAAKSRRTDKNRLESNSPVNQQFAALKKASSILGGIVAQVITISIYTPASGVELGKQRADRNIHENKSLSNLIKQKNRNTQPQIMPPLASLLD